jgi:hypothetical protein
MPDAAEWCAKAADRIAALRNTAKANDNELHRCINALDATNSRLETDLASAEVELATAIARLAALRKDAARWKTMSILWCAYEELEFRQAEDGAWTIDCRDGIECAPQFIAGSDPDAVMDTLGIQIDIDAATLGAKP